MKNLPRPASVRLSVLTAACQEPGVPRAEFQRDPLGAARKSALIWLDAANQCGLEGVQLAAALARPDSYLPPESLLDPVAAHLPIRTPAKGRGTDLSDADAALLLEACEREQMDIFDLGFFENLLHPNPEIRQQIHRHLLRCLDASVKLDDANCGGVTSFVGRHPGLTLDECIVMFTKEVIPLLRAFKKAGKILWIENCPMYGWGLAEDVMFNIACTPAIWITLSRIADKHNVGEALEFTHDPSHEILLGTTPNASFQVIKKAGFKKKIRRFHIKGQNVDRAKIAAHTSLGQRHGLGISDTKTGIRLFDPKVAGKAWGRLTALVQNLPGLSSYNVHEIHQGRTVDWQQYFLDIRRILGVKPNDTVCHIEHEWFPLRGPDIKLAQVLPAITLSGQFLVGIDGAADGIYRGEQYCRREKLPYYQPANPLTAIPGLDEEVERIMSIRI